MLAALLEAPATWGFLGAFIFAGPEWSTDVVLSKERMGWWPCTLKFLVALGIGTIFAAAFCPVVSEMLHRTSPAEIRGISALMGLAANPVYPTLIPALKGLALRMLEGKAK